MVAFRSCEFVPVVLFTMGVNIRFPFTSEGFELVAIVNKFSKIDLKVHLDLATSCDDVSSFDEKGR